MTQKYGDNELRTLLDLGSEVALSMSDDEIRQRAKEEGIDLHAQGNRFRDAVAAHAKAVKLSKLQGARARMVAESAARASERANSEPALLPLAEVIKRLTELVGLGIAEPNSNLTLAFRNASGELSEDDLRSLLNDYEELQRNERQGNLK